MGPIDKSPTLMGHRFETTNADVCAAWTSVERDPGRRALGGRVVARGAGAARVSGGGGMGFCERGVAYGFRERSGRRNFGALIARKIMFR